MNRKINILDYAKALCIQQKERLTKPRLEVLKIIAENSKPVGAYAILEELGRCLHFPKPPTAYRALDFWVQKGLIHRIESLNAYVICHADYGHEGSQFMVCDDCGVAIEMHIDELPETLKGNALENTFKPSDWTIEIHGLCNKCQCADRIDNIC